MALIISHADTRSALLEESEESNVNTRVANLVLAQSQFYFFTYTFHGATRVLKSFLTRQGTNAQDCCISWIWDCPFEQMQHVLARNSVQNLPL